MLFRLKEIQFKIKEIHWLVYGSQYYMSPVLRIKRYVLEWSEICQIVNEKKHIQSSPWLPVCLGVPSVSIKPAVKAPPSPDDDVRASVLCFSDSQPPTR